MVRSHNTRRGGHFVIETDINWRVLVGCPKTFSPEYFSLRMLATLKMPIGLLTLSRVGLTAARKIVSNLALPNTGASLSESRHRAKGPGDA